MNSSMRATVVDAADREPLHPQATHWETARPPATHVALQRFQCVGAANKLQSAVGCCQLEIDGDDT